MPIKVRCPSCKDAFQTSSKNRGRRVTCALCGATIRVSKRSKKKSRSSRSGGGDPSLSDGAIAAVLAEGEELPREYMPSVLDDEDPSEIEDGGSVIGATLESAVGTNGATEHRTGESGLFGEADSPATATELMTAPRPAQKPASKSGLDWQVMAPPFVVGVLVGAAVTASVLRSIGGGDSPPQQPVTPPQRVAPPTTAAAPPATAGEEQALLNQVTVASAKFETGGGLLGGGRTLVLRIKNDSGLVLRSATLDAELDLAAFDDAVLAVERVVADFSPVLGVGEEQEVRIAAPNSGPLATVKLTGPVRLIAKVVDLEWPGKGE